MDISLTDSISIAIGLSALILTLFQIYSTRKHNFLGVKPYLQFGWTAGETGDGVWIKNVGLGPAIINKFTIIQNGNEITGKVLSDQIFLLGIETRISVITNGSTMQEKDQRWIVRPKDNIVDGEAQDAYWGILEGIEFKVEYKSLYNRKQPNIHWIVPNPIKEHVRPKSKLRKEDPDNKIPNS